MIKDPALLEDFNRNLKRKERTDYAQSLRILEGMLEEAVYLGILPLRDPLEGIDVDIRIARVINSV